MSRLGGAILAGLTRFWPDPTLRRRGPKADVGTDEYGREYALEQFMSGQRHGSPLRDELPPLVNQSVLEIGCGPGGIVCYLAGVGASFALGVDLGSENLRYGRELARTVGRELPVGFCVMNAEQLALRDGSFDVVWADNAFEHFSNPGALMREAFRVLKPSGRLVVPIFCSIRTKWGLHLKKGLKLPWANLVFSEDSIVRALQVEAARRPELYESYPGLRDSPSRVRDVRRFRDLNDLTFAGFKALATEAGFTIAVFRVHTTRAGRLVRTLLPVPDDSSISDVFSTGCGAILEKPA